MNLLCPLLAKDLRRVCRNPWPWLIHLAIPLAITALLGLAFGRSRSPDAELGRIRFALVDEDDSALSRLLRGGLGQGEGGKYLEPVVLDRATALARLHANELAAVLVLPPHFTRDYLTARAPVTLELIKNPAQSIHPAVLEELLGTLVTGLNALARNLASEFPAWRAVLEDVTDYRRVADLIVRTGTKLDTWRRYLDPPLIGYTREVRPGAAGSGPELNLFGYLLAGLSAMFLLFQANTGMGDLYREQTGRTFARYHTLHVRLTPFLAAKGMFVAVMVLVSAAILLVGGGWLFSVRWQHPGVIVLWGLGYAVFAAGFAALLAALVPEPRMADALGNLIAMALGLAGGCAFAPEALPVFLREHITPWLPTAWLAQGLRELQFGNTPVDWPLTLVRLVALGVALLGLAAGLFRRRFARGQNV